MKRFQRSTKGNKDSKKSRIGFPAIPIFFWFFFASCGGGGGGSSTPLPTVHTDNATIVGQNAATLNGTVNPNGIATEAWFEYGTNPNLASFDNTTMQQFLPGSITQPIVQTVTGLTPGTIYYFRLVASSGNGWVEGEITSFTTRNPPPAVTTDAPSAITLTGGTLNGTVNPNGAVTEAWFEYGTDPNLANFAVTDNQTLAPGRDPVAIDNTLQGLNPGNTYYFRAVAASVEGVVEGSINSFSTDFPPPAATTDNATSITITGATLRGTVNPNGFSAYAWFEYGTDNTLVSFVETAHQPQGAGTGNQPVSEVVSLNAYTTYYFRMVAQSAGDPGVFTKGAIRSFPTGEYYVAVGDSITLGSHDDNVVDGIGYEPVLQGLLDFSVSKPYPIVVANAGVSGTESANGVSLIGNTMTLHPSARYFLILYGTNDAFIPPVSKAAYKSNMQAIITAIRNAGKVPYLAKVPFTKDPLRSDAAIQEYNQAIDELRASNGISVVAPDFYSWFWFNQGELADGTHPNGAGYRSMADLWYTVLTQ